jgi:tetratricopeptide (TPR) repeat protein
MSTGSGAVSCNHLCLSDMLLRCDYKNEAKKVLGFHDEDIEALKRLGIYSKREGSFDEALGYFMRLVEKTDELGTYLFSCTEIAKIYEHKLRDLHTALFYVQKADERLRRSLYLYPERELLFSREREAIEKRKRRLVVKIQKNVTRGVSR